MGVFGGRDNFSPKWITAMIVDSQNRIHLHPIKTTVGNDYFLAVINKDIYAFKIDPNRIMIWYATFTQSFRVLWFTTAHYMPVSAQDNKELELILAKNDLPKMNRLQFILFQQLTKREKQHKELGKGFTPHKLGAIMKEIEKHPDKNTEVLINLSKYIGELKKDQIVTPLKHITEFLWDDLYKTDPNFLESVPETMIKAEEENRVVTNSEIGAKRGWMKLLLVVMAVAVIGMVVYMAYSSGAFSQITTPFDAVGNFFKVQNQGGAGTTGGGVPPDCQGTVEACKTAVDSGRVKLAQLPEAMQKVVQNFKLPTVTPKEHTVELAP